MKKYFIICLITAFIAACSATQHLQPAEADLALAQQRIPGITITQLQDGYKLYVSKCSGCHRLHNPNEYSSDSWKPIIEKMVIKAKLTDDQTKQLISNYLIAKSR
jgi:cytochrome c5